MIRAGVNSRSRCLRRSLAVLGALLFAAHAGCSWQMPFGQNAQLAQLQQQHGTLVTQHQQLQGELAKANAANQQMTAELAKSRQDVVLAERRVELLNQQLIANNDQIDRLTGEVQEKDRRFETLAASAKRQGGAEISPNNSLDRGLPSFDLQGVEVRRDGDLVRVDIAASRLFAPDDARITPEGAALLKEVAAELAGGYRDQRIGVEGHTDNGQMRSARFTSHHAMSLAWAEAVMAHLSNNSTLSADQLFVAGYGASRPYASNASPAGQERNRRVELVIYPDTIGPRRGWQ